MPILLNRNAEDDRRSVLGLENLTNGVSVRDFVPQPPTGSNGASAYGNPYPPSAGTHRTPLTPSRIPLPASRAPTRARVSSES